MLEHTTRCLRCAGCVVQVNMEVEARVVGDMLKGDDAHELRLRLKEHKDEQFPFNDE